MNPELKETTELVRSVSRFLDNYRKVTRGTADESTGQAASRRVEEALIDCLAKATEELATDHNLPMWFDCPTCVGLHDLQRDIDALRRPRPLDAPPDYIVLMREHRYRHDHAKEVVRQLEARGWKDGETPNSQSRIEEGELIEA